MPWLLCLLAYSVYGFSGHQGIFSASKIDPVTLPIRIPDYRDSVFARKVLSRGFDCSILTPLDRLARKATYLFYYFLNFLM